MKKERIIIAVLLVLLVVVSTTGAFAYFNSAQTTTGTVRSGTLTMDLSRDGTNFGGNVGTPWDMTNMKPGDEVSGKLYIRNTGTIDSAQVTFEWGGILNNPATMALADKIILTHVWDSKNTVDAIAGVTNVADTNNDGKTSLAELAALSGRFGLPYDAVSDREPFLPAGDTEWLYMAFQFDPNANNDFQGNTMTYSLKITAEQAVVFKTN
ncbi:MAG TPA: TasA family protein [Anaerolineaceae bacterium]|jgi:predicted ribosomally synthesized peptide with SipW-like signal peptide